MNDRISLFLKAKNISPAQLADDIGVQRSGISHILNGRNKPSLDFIQRIIKKYPDISTNWLLFGEGPMMIPHLGASAGEVKQESRSSQMPVLKLFNDEEDGDTKNDNPEGVSSKQNVPESNEYQDINDSFEIESKNAQKNKIDRKEQREQDTGNFRSNTTETADNNSTNKIQESQEQHTVLSKPESSKEIERIIIFYKDRSFVEYFPAAQ